MGARSKTNRFEIERPLQKRTACITGGCFRIGRAISDSLAQAGAELILHHRCNETTAAERVAHRLRSRGYPAHTVCHDFSAPEDADRLYQTMAQQYSPVSILINNAAVFPEDDCRRIGIDAMSRTLSVNSLIPFRLGQRLYQQGAAGVIINILDTRINANDPAHASYQASKHLLMHLTEMMALAFAPRIRVNAIAPGLILPPPGKSAGYLSSRRKRTLLHRTGSPADIGAAVLFLCTQEFITGQTIYVDGGERIKRTAYE